MNNTYTGLVKQTFHFPQEGFEVGDNGYLEFNGLNLEPLIEKYGTPMKLTYLPKIGQQINKAKKMFEEYKAENINDALLNKIHSPAGIAIKSETPEEIAISIAAEIIAVKNQL